MPQRGVCFRWSSNPGSQGIHEGKELPNFTQGRLWTLVTVQSRQIRKLNETKLGGGGILKYPEEKTKCVAIQT